MRERIDGRALLLLAAGFAIWAVAFVALYAMLSVGCRFGWDGIGLFGGVTLQRAQLVALFLVHVAAGLALVLVLRREGVERPFLRSAAHLAALAALGSTLFSFSAVFVLSSCV